jgi:hypothetical protein
MLESWSECPLTTSSLFIVPRTDPAFWWGLSWDLVELPSLYPHLTPLRYQLRQPIPIVVLYLPPHEHSLPTEDRLARPPLAANAFWHRQQAALMHGLLPKPVE